MSSRTPRAPSCLAHPSSRAPTEGDRVAVSGTDGRFVVETPASGAVTLIVRAPGFAEKQQTTEPNVTTVTVTLEPSSLREDITVTAARTEQRLGDVPASVSVLRSVDIKQSPAVSADDVLRQMPTFSLFTRSSSLSSQPDVAGRVAARHRSERRQPHARAARRRSVQRSVRRLGVLDARAARIDRADRGRRRPEREPVRQLRDGRRHQHQHRRGRRGRRSTSAAQYGNHNSPKLDFFGGDVWGKVGLLVDGSFFRSDGFPIVIENERGLVDNKSNDAFKNVNVKANFTATTEYQRFRADRRTSTRIGTTASTARSTAPRKATTPPGSTSAAACASSCRTRAALQATVFGNVEDYFSNFLAVPAATPARSIGRMSLNQTVPTKDIGGMVQWSKSFSKQLLQVGTDWHWVERRQPRRRAQRHQRPVGHHASRVRRHAAQRRRVRAGHDHADQQPRSHAQRARRFLEQLRRAQPRDESPSGTPTVNNNPNLPGQDDTVVTPRVAAIYHATDKRRACGATSAQVSARRRSTSCIGVSRRAPC